MDRLEVRLTHPCHLVHNPIVDDTREAPKETLFVVMPAYNEAQAVEAVVREWIPVLRERAERFTLFCIDDGSTDETGRILDGLALEIPELEVVHKRNEGHGAACRDGYRACLDRGAAWMLQLDSDGQCDPADFRAFWENREAGPVFGSRRREDGAARIAISFALSKVVRWRTGMSVPDPNVPFRLLHRDVLAGALDALPSEFELYNVGLTASVAHRHAIRWTPIRFRKRIGGETTTSWLGLAGRCVRVIRDLGRLRGRSD